MEIEGYMEFSLPTLEQDCFASSARPVAWKQTVLDQNTLTDKLGLRRADLFVLAAAKQKFFHVTKIKENHAKRRTEFNLYVHVSIWDTSKLFHSVPTGRSLRAWGSAIKLVVATLSFG